MAHRIVSAPARPVRWSLVTTAVALAFLGVTGVSGVHAQAPKPKTPPKTAPKKQPTPAQAQQPPAAPAQAGPVQMPQLIYTPWAKFCGKGNAPDAKQVCFTGKDARTEAGVPMVAAALIEPDGEPTKLFRVTLPMPLQLRFGARLIIDQQEPIGAPFVTCFANGCLAEFPGTPDFVTKLKKGQMLTIQAINLAGVQISFPLPLNDFAKANEGPPTDPKVYEEQQKKLQDELQKRAEEARKKLEQQQGAPTAPKQ
ncbi:MAG TPA: invasion associated locus B family protein [Xanthobacteraceae bacterium]|nr:invasion associated locus B family protein [Xanthobacteraceae bacterium]